MTKQYKTATRVEMSKKPNDMGNGAIRVALK